MYLRSVLIVISTACVLAQVASVRGAGEPRRPNIIAVFADDTGYGELGCYGNKEAMAGGVRLTAENGRFSDDFGPYEVHLYKLQ